METILPDNDGSGQSREYVLRMVEERGIRSVQLWFTDVLGTLKAVTIAPAELADALEDGMTFDGSSIDGFSRVQEADMVANPDPETFEILPWRNGSGEALVARIFCDISNTDGTAFEGSPRYVLAQAMKSAKEAGYTFFAAPEIEYFYFGGSEGSSGPDYSGPRLLDSRSYFDLASSELTSELCRQSVEALEDMGIPVEHTQHEDAPSQHEIDLRYTDALTMADTVMTARMIVKEVARRHGVFASFMPKPRQDLQGSGMHTHLSLFLGDANAFYSADDPVGLSSTARQFVAGLISHAPEITAVTNQWVNSYKRLVPGFEAPTHATWARNNRSALVRVPHVRHARPETTRIEYRATDSGSNPYLAFAMLLAAGMQGIREGYELPGETTVNVFETAPQELRNQGVAGLPQDLSEAISLMEQSSLARHTLGEHAFEWFIRNKREECRQYREHVSSFELDRYLHIL